MQEITAPAAYAGRHRLEDAGAPCWPSRQHFPFTPTPSYRGRHAPLAVAAQRLAKASALYAEATARARAAQR